MVDYGKEIEKLLKVSRKLDLPPSAPNWVRFIFDDLVKTTRSILKFAKGQPAFNYQPAYTVIKDRIELAISIRDALNIVTNKGAPAGREQNKLLVKAFFEHDLNRKFSASNPIGFDREFFRVSREVIVPVAPLSIIREKGKFVPIFVCGWNTNPLNLKQRRLLMTVLEDAFLSLTDFRKAPAEILFFPTQDGARKPEIWKRGDYDLLSASELTDCVELFMEARDSAREQLIAEIETLRERAKTEAEKPTEKLDEVLPLFKKP